MDQVELTAKQTEAAEAVLSGDYTQILYGGAIRGGKTVWLLETIFLLCRVFAGSRWAIVRKDLPTLRRNTIPSFNLLRPERFVGAINQSDWTARCSN